MSLFNKDGKPIPPSEESKKDGAHQPAPASADFRTGEIIIIKNVFFKITTMHPSTGVIVLMAMTQEELNAAMKAQIAMQEAAAKKNGKKPGVQIEENKQGE